MKTFMVRNADGDASEWKPYEAATLADAAERFASDAYYARKDRDVDAYELLVTVDVDVQVDFHAFINPADSQVEH